MGCSLPIPLHPASSSCEDAARAVLVRSGTSDSYEEEMSWWKRTRPLSNHPRSNELKDRVTEAIFAHRDDIYAIGDAIYADPELGFKEFRTAARVSQYFDTLGLAHRSGLAITGIKAVLDTGRPGPTVCIMGELDSIIVFDHPDANPETGAAHCCGHNAQIAGMLSAATGIVKSGALEHLSGKLVFIAVPAEEYVEIRLPLPPARRRQVAVSRWQERDSLPSESSTIWM